MAQYKSEVLHRTYRKRLRPVNHYALGWLPRWAGMVTRVPAVARLVNAVLGRRPVAKLVMRLGGMDPRSEEHTSELQSRGHLVCRLLLEKKNTQDARRV